MRYLPWLILVGGAHVIQGLATSSIKTKTQRTSARRTLAALCSTKGQGKGSDKKTQVANPDGLPSLTQVDVIYGSRKPLVYNDRTGRFLPMEQIRTELEEIKLGGFFLSPIFNSPPVTMCRKMVDYHIKPYMAAAFVPEGVTPSYHAYTKWRILQRLINANLQVFGTQSLLLGLGIKTKSLAAVSAALNWVLKDALGKIVRMIWASKMGGRFDSDAKRWRMRASFLYAFGNGMEIATYIVPQLFLLFATGANCCKQMSMLTCSSTRTALYNSFRDGTRENIGDITAKGEASIAVVDLIGIGTGVYLSRMIGTSVGAVAGMYVVLQTIELVCIYYMMRTVQFRVLNFERLVQVLQDFTGAVTPSTDQQSNPSSHSTISSSTSAHLEVNTNKTNNGASSPSNSRQAQRWTVKTPEEMADQEKILMPPNHLARRALAFGSLSRARLDPDELTQLLDIFSKEKFLLVVGQNMKKKRRFGWRPRDPTLQIQENCHIVLHTEAASADIVKSSLALILLRQKLSRTSDPPPDQIRSGDCLDLLRDSCQEADRLLPRLLKQLANRGWTSPARYMFGRVTMRADWPLKTRQQAKKA